MSTAFIVFFSVFFSFYFLVNFYVFKRARQAFGYSPNFIKYFNIGFWLLPISFILGRVLENWGTNIYTAMFIWVGSLWMGALLYSVLSLLLIDIVRLVYYIVRKTPFWHPLNPVKKYKIGLGVFCFVFLLVLGGALNANMPKVKEINIEISKPSLSDRKDLKMLVASDIHLGTLVGKRKFQKLVDAVKSTQPDIILFAGDVIDEDIKPVINEDMGNKLEELNPKMGVFAITGNHEYIGGVENAVKYMEKHGVRVLRDDSVLVDGSFYLVGREDISSERMGGKKRKELQEILKGIPEGAPVVLLDHQPFHLKQVADTGRIDLQISGHTHNGQLWPINYIIDAIYEIPYGHGRINNTQFYVSSGFGTWGPPVRVGNRPEIVIMNIIFKM